MSNIASPRLKRNKGVQAGNGEKGEGWSRRRGRTERALSVPQILYRPLAPSLGCSPEQKRLRFSPDSPVTKREDAERDTDRQRLGGKPWSRTLRVSFCPPLTSNRSMGVGFPSVRRWKSPDVHVRLERLPQMCSMVGRATCHLQIKCSVCQLKREDRVQ